MRTKTSSSIFIFFRGDNIFTFVKFQILGGQFKFLLNKKGLNKDIDFTAKTKKKPSKKAIFDKTKTSHQRLLESSESDVFGLLNF